MRTFRGDLTDRHYIFMSLGGDYEKTFDTGQPVGDGLPCTRRLRGR